MDNLLTRKEAANRLGVSLVKLDAERAAGQLAYIQRAPGAKVWIPESAVEDYLKRGMHAALPPRSARETYRKRRASRARA